LAPVREVTWKRYFVFAVLFLLLFGLPIAFVSFNIGPGRWINGIQDLFFGWHNLELTFLIVLLAWDWLLLVLVKVSGKLMGRSVAGMVARWRRQ
jgi:hypothetical protein